MELIIGGAYQGKTEYAREHYGIPEEEIFRCGADGRIDPGCRCIAGLETYAAACAQQGTAPLPPEAFRPDAVLLFTDVFCGVVPADACARRDREAAGRYGRLLAEHAAHVTRIQFGIPEALR